MGVMVAHIPTDQIAAYWGDFSEYIKKAAARYEKDYDFADVARALGEGRSALFGVWVDDRPQAALVVSEVVYPKRKKMLIELVGGDNVDKWYEEAIEKLSDVAQSAGYAALVSNARLGWTKMAKSVNFKQAHVAYEREF